MPSTDATSIELSAGSLLRRRVLGGLAAGTVSIGMPAVVRAQSRLQVIYPPPASPSDARAGYYLELLELVLGKSGAAFDLKPYPAKMVGARAYHALEKNESITIVWCARSRQLDERLLPVKIDLDRGILGWRLLLIRSRDREMFGRIRRLEQLRAYAAGQQRDWIDTSILRANGLRVVPALLYESMFDMLAAGRFDYCPRGVAEIWDEARQYSRLELEVEPTLALHYPFTTWFYVSRHNPQLAVAVERGLQQALNDGSMARLFELRNGESMRRAKLAGRTVFELTGA